jgi:hypothetical protein
MKGQHKKYKGYKVCKFGLACSCCPPPKERRNDHRRNMSKFYRDEDRLVTESQHWETDVGFFAFRA